MDGDGRRGTRADDDMRGAEIEGPGPGPGGRRKHAWAAWAPLHQQQGCGARGYGSGSGVALHKQNEAVGLHPDWPYSSITLLIASIIHPLLVITVVADASLYCTERRADVINRDDP